MPLSRITPLDVQTAYDRLRDELSPNTIRTMHGILKSALLQAVRWRLLTHNPADGVDLPPKRPREISVWTVAEQERFLAATAKDANHPLWCLLLDTGLRIGEALALRWSDCELAADPPTVHVQRTITEDANGRPTIGDYPKTARSRRLLSIEPETARALTRHKVKQHERRLAAGAHWQDTQLVFDRGDGGMRTNGGADYHLRKAAHAAGLAVLPLHGLRKTMTVTWLRAGVNPRVVSQRLGHSSVSFTLDVYASVSGEWQAEAVDQVVQFKAQKRPS